MSHRGSQCIAWLVEGERQVKWWARYADRLTPDEMARIRGKGGEQGDYRAFWRPLEPSFHEGALLNAGRNLSVRISAVELHKGEWRIRLSHVKDDRTSNALQRRVHEVLDPQGVTTLDISSERSIDPPEPERIPHRIVEGLPSSIEARQRYEREQERRRQELDEMPLGERVARLEIAGGTLARRQLRAIRAQLAEGERRAGLRRAS